ncbi:glycosyltransferase family 4 protein [Mongoliitalea daihaiensis]|uniref:glycosyltransferase family 4 protein n=1 Tax=Mongoliitalea daihaiensis TaxID=2782006 RepID=UPI001F2F53F7|nr:glycosyltransferase family 4 protein [Mongoliitalea daihaiensis]UJP66000.1 glycosyltransferase family 4 protein [Mongoliitalea daihaiensis]
MSKSQLKVGFLTALDPLDKRSWSGIYFRMLQTLQEKFQTVIVLGPVKLSFHQRKLLDLRFFFSKVKHRLFYGKKYNVAHNHTLSKMHGAYFSDILQQYELDVIFAPTGSVEIAHLQTSVPICYFSDATFELVCQYYDAFKNLSSKSIQESNEIEAMAIQQSTTQVFSSQWAINSAIQVYQAKNTYLVKMGANLDRSSSYQVKERNSSKIFSLLFIGVDWKRKGGPIVLESLDILEQRGFSFQLTIIGCIPDVQRSYMHVIPFLDKNNAADAERLEMHLKEADVLFMPTRADCTPIAFGEANAYGVPVISTHTGGVSDMIENHVNGILLDYHAPHVAYADVLESLIENPEHLEKLSKQARKKYEEELNWNTWAERLKEILIHTANH